MSRLLKLSCNAMFVLQAVVCFKSDLNLSEQKRCRAARAERAGGVTQLEDIAVSSMHY